MKNWNIARLQEILSYFASSRIELVSLAETSGLDFKSADESCLYKEQIAG
jgi:hypothetical protein